MCDRAIDTWPVAAIPLPAKAWNAGASRRSAANPEVTAIPGLAEAVLAEVVLAEVVSAEVVLRRSADWPPAAAVPAPGPDCVLELWLPEPWLPEAWLPESCVLPDAVGDEAARWTPAAAVPFPLAAWVAIPGVELMLRFAAARPLAALGAPFCAANSSV